MVELLEHDVSIEVFHDRLTEHLALRYPSTYGQLGKPNWSTLVSPYALSVDGAIYNQACLYINTFWNLSQDQRYRASVLPPEYQGVKNHSVLMAYDFHLDSTNTLRLVEINTNASGFLINQIARELKGFDQNELVDLQNSFQEEWNLVSSESGPRRVAIADDEVTAQKMLYEFHLYQEWMARFGWTAEICETKEVVGKKIDFVYNRSTRFDLQGEDIAGLREAWIKGRIVVSPNPAAYSLLADKGRLIEIFSQWTEAYPKLKPTLLFAAIVDANNREEMWLKRKTMFFKPLRSHGGKSVYRGEGISRKRFDDLPDGKTLAQEYVRAPEIKIKTQTWKYDLRFYVYKNRVQSAVARLFQGQVTNFATPGGGFCPIFWKK